MQLLAFAAIIISTLFIFADAQDPTRCAGSSDPGLPCHAHKGPPVQMFYFDMHMGVCQPFTYNGCYGNGNRFETAETCRTNCATFAVQSSAAGRGANATGTCPGGSSPYMANGVPVKCAVARDCMSGYGCSKEACCQKANICTMSYDSGKEDADGDHTPRYYYNTEYKACMKFSYFGLQGNANNFANYNDCMAFCS